MECEPGNPRHAHVGAAFDDIKTAAELYGIFEDLFSHAYFRPCVHLDVKYRYQDVLVPVYRGNMVKPSEAAGRQEPSQLEQGAGGPGHSVPRDKPPDIAGGEC